MNLPLPVVCLPDHDILAHVQKPVLAVKKVIGAHFIDRVRQPIEMGGLAWHGADAHVETALPEGLDRGPPADGRTVSWHNLSGCGVQRCHSGCIPLLKTVLPLALYDTNNVFAFIHRGRRNYAGQREPPVVVKAATVKRSGDER